MTYSSSHSFPPSQEQTNRFLLTGNLTLPPTFLGWLSRCYDLNKHEKKQVIDQAIVARIQPYLSQNSFHLINWETESIPRVGGSVPIPNVSVSRGEQPPVFHPTSRSQPRSPSCSSSDSESSIPDTISKVKRGRSSRHSSQSRGPPKIGKKKSLSKTPPEEDHKIEERAERFKQDYRTELRKRAESRASLLPTPESVNTEGPILGRCTKLEKKYLRLTGAPDPDTVRPLPILKKAFEMVRQRWSDGTDYEWVCEQLMSIRQDLTVQHLGETEFAVCVYESHARIAISSNDLSEYNRCQTMLSKLYRQGIKGCVMEFTSYQLLYWLCTGDSASFTLYLRQLSPRARSHSFILLPLSLFQVLQSQNWVRFHSIRARVEADARPVQKTPKPPPQFPPLARLFMQRFEETFRTTGFATLCTTIKPSLHLHDATTTLGFCSANVDPSHSELNECFSWLVSKRATFVPPVSNPRHVNLSSPPALDTVQSYASALASTKPVLSVSSSPDPSLSPQNDGSGYDSAPDRTYGVSPSPTPEKGGTRANTIGQKTLDITAMLRKKK